MRLAVKLALGLAVVVGSAQAAETPQPIVLKAAYLFDSKSGNLTNGGAVLVEGDKIKIHFAGMTQYPDGTVA